MRKLRLLAGVTAALASGLLMQAPAHADTIVTMQFSANSGESPCVHGSTSGTLIWNIGSTTPPGTTLPVQTAYVNVVGAVFDQPMPTSPATCPDDGYSSTARFTGYLGNTPLATRSFTTDNSMVRFNFALSAITAPPGVGRIDRVVVQVCRDPVVTLPPSYCGRAVEYRLPIVIGPWNPWTGTSARAAA